MHWILFYVLASRSFKVVITLQTAESAWAEWEKAGFAPEKGFLEDAAAVAGVSSVETQTYTFEAL